MFAQTEICLDSNMNITEREEREKDGGGAEQSKKEKVGERPKECDCLTVL